jgi:hypothetical protein
MMTSYKCTKFTRNSNKLLAHETNFHVCDQNNRPMPDQNTQPFKFSVRQHVSMYLSSPTPCILIRYINICVDLSKIPRG